MARRRWMGIVASVAASVATAAVAVVGSAGTTGAMTANAHPDGDAHPAVVALLYSSSPGRASMFCSGTLISARVVVTASHCASFADTALDLGKLLVTNEPWLTDDPNGVIDLSVLTHVSGVSRIAVNPRYKPGVGTDSYREDVSALVVSDPAALGRPGGVTYPSMPTAGILDALQRGGQLRSTPIQVMGYGTEAQVNGPGGRTFVDSGERRVADMSVAALNQQVLHESQQVHQGSAGACYGDSGGPTFATVGTAWTILGVTSTGDIPCWATNTAARIDRTSVLEFLQSVVASA